MPVELVSLRRGRLASGWESAAVDALRAGRPSRQGRTPSGLSAVYGGVWPSLVSAILRLAVLGVPCCP